MRTRGRQSPYERVELAGFLAEFREALEDEIEEIKKSGQSSIMLSHGRQIESHNNAYEQECPICKSEMLIRESDAGGIYWLCANGDYSRSAEQPYPKDGILRCKCGAPYKFAMKNEPRWVCSVNPKHYQKMRKNDLNLVKMAALIPKEDRGKVYTYFTWN